LKPIGRVNGHQQRVGEPRTMLESTDASRSRRAGAAAFGWGGRDIARDLLRRLPS
jgi:hypothetical protein